MIRIYRLNILQVTDHDDAEKYLHSLLKINNCTVLRDLPKPKSSRLNPKRGLKWIDGVIEINFDDKTCYQTFVNKAQHNGGYFNISLRTLTNN